MTAINEGGHLVELSPPETKPLVWRPNTVRDYVLWSEMATTRQNLDFFDTPIKLHADDWPGKIEGAPIATVADKIRGELPASTWTLVRTDWRRLFQRAIFAEAKNAYVDELPLLPDRLALRLIFLLFRPPNRYRSAIPDGGLITFLRYFLRFKRL